MKKILIWNILFILLTFIFAEMACMVYECSIIKNELLTIGTSNEKIKENLKWFISSSYRKGDFDAQIRQPSITNSKKPSILVMGCSYAYGWLLDDKDCLHSVLSEMTGRSVYNIAMGSGSPREMLYMLENQIAMPPPDRLHYLCIYR